MLTALPGSNNLRPYLSMGSITAQTIKRKQEIRKRQEYQSKRLARTKKFKISYRQGISQALLDILKGKPFWRWELTEDEHHEEWLRTWGKCCFCHIVGLPDKHGVRIPLYPKQKEFCDILDARWSDDDQYAIANGLVGLPIYWALIIIKSTGVGATHLKLLYYAWKCVFNDYYRGSLFALVTGPSIVLAIDAINRFKFLFIDWFGSHASFQSDKTVAWLNHVKIQAFPSHNINAIRGLPKVGFVDYDEFAFFPTKQAEISMDAGLRYITKYHSQFVGTSTPNVPGDLLDQYMQKAQHEQALIDEGSMEVKDQTFKLLVIHWKDAIDYVYTMADIDKARQYPSFPREFDLQFGVGMGNIFTENSLKIAMAIGRYLKDVPVNPNNDIIMSIDPAWSSSLNATVITEYIPNVQLYHAIGEQKTRNLIRVCYSELIDSPEYTEQIVHWQSLIRKYKVSKIYVDGNNSNVIQTLKAKLRDYPVKPLEYAKVLARARQTNRHPSEYMNVVPVYNGTQGEEILLNAKSIVEYRRNIAIDEEDHLQLIRQMRSAVQKPTGYLDKDDSDKSKSFDALEALFYNLYHYTTFYKPLTFMKNSNRAG